MTEAEWLACADPEPMLEFLRGRTSERKLRLFACACCRLVWYAIPDGYPKKLVEVGERLADGLAGEGLVELVRRNAQAAIGARPDGVYNGVIVATAAANQNSWRAAYETWGLAVEVVTQRAVSAVSAGGTAAYDSIIRSAAMAWKTAWSNAPQDGRESSWNYVRNAAWQAAEEAARIEAKKVFAPHVRDILGNPFRPVAADPAWLSSTVVGLASAIYADRAFDRLPILADALEDAGCDNPDVLAHCRTHPEHARGCWVVDLILGKT